MRYIAIDDDAKLVVSEKLLKISKVHILLEKLNKAGFGLGSGHDGMNLEKKGDDYVFTLCPYVGHGDQVVIFEPLENDRFA
jgi:hypothetical protein